MIEKQRIISEIQRTAAKNDGKPLGIARFKAETGIDRNDWFGIYWARWGDALQEAGFAPNTLRSAYSDQWVLEQFVRLIRELGHFPSLGERLLRARRDKSFPTPRVFERFGRKVEFAARIVEFCIAQRGFEDVLSICRPIAETVPVESSDSAGENFGRVYLVRSGRFYKIGQTNDLGRRHRQLEIQLPQKATPVHSIVSDDPVGIEAYWHRRFKAKRLHGEWFNLDPADIRAFKRRRFM